VNLGLTRLLGILGDRIGRRRILLIGAAAFGVASILAAFSTNAEMLIATRAVLGLAGATLAPGNYPTTSARRCWMRPDWRLSRDFSWARPSAPSARSSWPSS